MKKIVLVRHAKSSWKFPELKDMDRPLKKKGLYDAPLMGKALKEMQVIPDVIISSPADRAITTAKIIAEEIGLNENQIVTNPKLYMESTSQLLNEIKSIDEKYSTVFLIGHNPGLTDLANSLSGESIDNIPTSGAMAIQFDGATWQEIEKGKGKKLFFEVPKNQKKKLKKAKDQNSKPKKKVKKNKKQDTLAEPQVT